MVTDTYNLQKLVTRSNCLLDTSEENPRKGPHENWCDERRMNGGKRRPKIHIGLAKGVGEGWQAPA